jgi:hypothetical protein
LRPCFDNLEDRVMLSTVHWINTAGGNWGTAANWDSHAVPGASDDVIIDVPGNVTIIHDTGTDTVHSLVSQQNLMLSGTSSLTISGSFMESSGRTVTARDSARLSVNGTTTTTGADLTAAGGTISLNGSATITGGHVTALGGALTLAGVTTLTGVNLSAESGGTISLPSATGYDGTGNVSLTVRATGAGSRVDLSHVTQWQGAGSTGNPSWVSVEALNGGSVDLRQVAQITSGNTRFLVQGTGSQVNLTALTSMTGARNDANILEADSGGAITAPSLASLDTVSLRMSGNGVLPASHIGTFQNGNVFLDNSASLALPQLTSFNGSGNRTLTLQADHGSQLDLSAVTQWQGAGSASNPSTILVQALNGSSVNLSRVAQLAVGNSTFQANGMSSRINLTALTGFTGARSDVSVLEADAGGTITAPNLASLNTVDLRASGTGTLPTAHVGTFQSGDVYLTNHASLALPLVTSFNGSGIRSFTVQADQGSRLDLSAVTQWQGAGGTDRSAAVLVQALNGSTVDLSRVGQISAGNSAFQSSGTGSQVLLTALTSFSGARNDASLLQADAGGTITAANLTSLNGVTLKVTGSGVLPTAHVTTFLNSNATVDASGTLALPLVTSFNGSGSRPLTLQADHGSRLDLSAVTQWQGAGGADDSNAILVRALNGSSVDLSRVAQITAGNTAFRSSGTGSQLVLTALTRFAGARSDASVLQADAGGTMTAPNLAALDTVTLQVSGNGTLPTARVSSLLNSNIFVSGSGSLSFPQLTQIDGTGPRSLTLQVDTSGRLDLSQVTQWQGAGSSSDSSQVVVQALGGGTIDVSRLAQVAVGNTLFWAEGTGSRISLTALTSFSGASARANMLQADTGGTIALSSSTTLIGTATVVLATAGTVADGTIQLAAGSSLTGSGTIMGNLVNSAVVDTGQDPAGTILVTGTYQQTTAGTLSDLGTLTVNGLLTWQGGTMTDPGQTNANGGLALSGPAIKTLDARALNVGGAGTWTGGDLNIGDGAEFAILPGGSLDAQSNQVVLNTLGGDAAFVNAGLFRRSAGVGTTTIQIPFANPGTLQVQAGTGLDLTGAFTSITNTTLNKGTYLISGTFQIVNPSIVTNGGAITLDGATAGIVNQSGHDVLANLQENDGILTIQNGRRFTTGGDFTDTGMIAVGTGGTLTVTGVYTESGTLAVQAGGSVNLNGGGTADGSVRDAGTVTLAAGTTFTIGGSYTEMGTLIIPDLAMLTAAGTFTNLAGGMLTGGTYQVAGDLSLPAALTTNAANLVLDGPDAQVTDLNGNDLLAGLAANAGHLTIRNGGSLTTGGNFANSGTITVAADSSLTVTGTYTQTAQGMLAVPTGGTVNLNGGGTADGTISDAGVVIIAAGTTFTVSGSYTEMGTLAVPDTATLVISGTLTNLAADGTLTGGSYLIGGTWKLHGTLTTNAATLVLDGPDVQITDLAGNNLLARLNANTGSLTIQDGGGLTTGGSFANSRTLLVAADSALTVTGAFTQTSTGTLTVQTGGSVRLNGGGMADGTISDAGAVTVGAGTTFTVNGSYTEMGTLTVVDTATLVMAGTLTNLAGNGTLTGGTYRIAGTWKLHGTLTTNAAALILDGPHVRVTDLTGTDLLAGLNTNQSSLTIQDGAGFTTGGRFINSGTITVGAASTFRVAGALTQSGTLSVQAGGTLNLNGGGSAGGTLTDAGAVTIAAGTTFTVSGNYTEMGTVTVPATATLVISGTLTNLAAGTLTGGTYMTGGTWKLAGTLTTNAATLVLNSPTAQVTDLSGNDLLHGLTTNAGNLILVNGFNLTAPGAFTNTGTLTVDLGSTLTVTGTYTQSGTGMLAIGASGSVNLNGGGMADGVVNDAGALTLAAGTTLTVVGSYTELGTLTVPDTATLVVTGTFTNLGDDGTLTGGTYLITGTLQLPGAIVTNAANLVLDGPDSQILDPFGDDALAGFAVNAADGTFTIQNGRNFTTAGDLVNFGELVLGAGSTLTVSGDFTQDALATLTVQLGGTPDTGQFGQLSVLGTANLDGTLQVTLTNDYVPSTGDAFQILTYGSRGSPPSDFANPPDGFDLNYDDDGGSLTIVAQ